MHSLSGLYCPENKAARTLLSKYVSAHMNRADRCSTRSVQIECPDSATGTGFSSSCWRGTEQASIY